LDHLVELFGFPNWFEPIQGHCRHSAISLAATAALAKDDLSQRPAAGTQARPAALRQGQILNLAQVVHANVLWQASPNAPLRSGEVAKSSNLRL
jgi:hypothetical protein